MVDVGKREDRLLDFITAMKTRIDMAIMEIELYRESGGLTAHEIEILNALHKHLVVPAPDLVPSGRSEK